VEVRRDGWGRWWATYVDDGLEYDERHHGDLFHADDADAFAVDVVYAAALSQKVWRECVF
jgi:hypothetical protein